MTSSSCSISLLRDALSKSLEPTISLTPRKCKKHVTHCGYCYYTNDSWQIRFKPYGFLVSLGVLGGSQVVFTKQNPSQWLGRLVPKQGETTTSTSNEAEFNLAAKSEPPPNMIKAIFMRAELQNVLHLARDYVATQYRRKQVLTKVMVPMRNETEFDLAPVLRQVTGDAKIFKQRTLNLLDYAIAYTKSISLADILKEDENDWTLIMSGQTTKDSERDKSEAAKRFVIECLDSNYETLDNAHSEKRSMDRRQLPGAATGECSCESSRSAMDSVVCAEASSLDNRFATVENLTPESPCLRYPSGFDSSANVHLTVKKRGERMMPYIQIGSISDHPIRDEDVGFTPRSIRFERNDDPHLLFDSPSHPLHGSVLHEALAEPLLAVGSTSASFPPDADIVIEPRFYDPFREPHVATASDAAEVLALTYNGSVDDQDDKIRPLGLKGREGDRDMDQTNLQSRQEPMDDSNTATLGDQPISIIAKADLATRRQRTDLSASRLVQSSTRRSSRLEAKEKGSVESAKRKASSQFVVNNIVHVRARRNDNFSITSADSIESCRVPSSRKVISNSKPQECVHNSAKRAILPCRSIPLEATASQEAMALCLPLEKVSVDSRLLSHNLISRLQEDVSFVSENRDRKNRLRRDRDRRRRDRQCLEKLEVRQRVQIQKPRNVIEEIVTDQMSTRLLSRLEAKERASVEPRKRKALSRPVVDDVVNARARRNDKVSITSDDIQSCRAPSSFKVISKYKLEEHVQNSAKGAIVPDWSVPWETMVSPEALATPWEKLDHKMLISDYVYGGNPSLPFGESIEAASHAVDTALENMAPPLDSSEYIEEERVYNRNIRLRSRLTESERAVRAKEKLQCEEQHLLLNQRNTKKSPEELLMEEFQNRTIIYALVKDRPVALESRCGVECCRLCSPAIHSIPTTTGTIDAPAVRPSSVTDSWREQHIMDEEPELTGFDLKEKGIPSPIQRRKSSRRSDRSAGKAGLMLREMKFTLKFIDDYNRGY